MQKILLLILFTFPTLLSALQERPWYDRDLEFHTSLGYAHQRFTRFNSNGETFNNDAKDDFYQGNLWLSYAEYSAELEMTFVKSKERSFGLDHISELLRYQFFNENLGDLVTANAGLLLSQVPTIALHDFTVLHQGNFEAELSLVFGKMLCVSDYWNQRFWTLAAIGTGDHGSAYARALLAVEKQWYLDHYFGILAEWRRGFGGKNLFPHDFVGYGPISYRFVDLKMYYVYELNCDIFIELDYILRVHAHNCPDNLNRFQVSLQYSFGL